MSGYHETYDRWRDDPQAFWAEAARAIDWIRPPERIFDPEGGVYGRWFPDARCNACFNALDRHVEAGRGDQSRSTTIARLPGLSAPLAIANCSTRRRRSAPCSAILASLRAIGS